MNSIGFTESVGSELRIDVAPKTCARCRKAFIPAPNAMGRNRARCKPCNAKAAVEYRKKYPRELAEREKARAADPDRAEKVALWSRKSKLAKYGLTTDQYDVMLARQNGVCAICEKPESTPAPRINPRLKGRMIVSLAVDHKHGTGFVRGLLCAKCNRAIGFLQESPALARKLADYLEQHDARPCILV